MAIESFVKEGKLDEATKMVNEMLEIAQVPVIRIFRYYFKEMSQKGMADTLISLGTKMSDVSYQFLKVFLSLLFKSDLLM